jgi:HAD superfamily hydrolase (TIGR01458 family)
MQAIRIQGKDLILFFIDNKNLLIEANFNIIDFCEAHPMKEVFDAIFFDIDGVLEFQGKPYPGAVELLDFLRRKGIIIRILTNSTLKSRQHCAARLAQLGFDVLQNEVITASYATSKYLKTLNPKSCWVLLKGKGIEEFEGFHADPENPEYIVLGDYRDGFNFENMNKVLKRLLAGAKLIVMIAEKVDHSMGEVELTVGAYGKMLADAAGIEAVYIGKPNKFIFEVALSTMDVDRSKVLMVGDRVETDIKGAQAAGIRSVLVKTGEFKAADLNSDVRPDYIVDAVKEIAAFF